MQLRLKGRSTRELLEVGRALRSMTHEVAALLLVNERPDLALALGADGVHLPESGLEIRDVRRLLGVDAWIGRSCHDRAGLERAVDEGADYATLSPLFSVPGKSAPLGVSGFSEARAGIELPVLALGGIDETSLGDARAAGADGVALIRGAYRSGDPEATVSAILRLLDTMRARGG